MAAGEGGWSGRAGAAPGPGSDFELDDDFTGLAVRQGADQMGCLGLCACMGAWRGRRALGWVTGISSLHPHSLNDVRPARTQPVVASRCRQEGGLMTIAGFGSLLSGAVRLQQGAGPLRMHACAGLLCSMQPGHDCLVGYVSMHPAASTSCRHVCLTWPGLI